MRATSLGHATWLIEAGGARLLTDPVLRDPFEQGAVTSCPSRTLSLERLPEVDALFLSHRHLDHYDFVSLDRFSRELPLFCPDDPLLHGGLRAMGFRDLRVLTPFEPVDWRGARLTATPSQAKLPEVGLLIQDDSGALYNQVDTLLGPREVKRIREITALDVHLAMYASQDFAVFESARQDVAQLHAANLNVALSLGARLVVPASGGFRFADRFDWLNAHVFPISRELFAADLARLAQTRTAQMDPGDVVTIDGEVTVAAQAADFVARGDEGTERFAYDPTAPIPALTESEVDPALEGWVDALLERLPAFIGDAGRAGDPVVHEYFRRGVTYRLEAVLPARTRAITYSFEPSGRCRILEGDPAPEPQVRHRFVASALRDLFEGRISCFVYRCSSRRSSRVLEVTTSPQGARVTEHTPSDLLTHAVVNLKAADRGRDAAFLEYYGLVPPPELCRS